MVNEISFAMNSRSAALFYTTAGSNLILPANPISGLVKLSVLLSDRTLNRKEISGKVNQETEE